ncbi:MAG: ATP-binding protein [Planctomycetia bacterium]|jgi:signal transduction histidine kinase
MRSHKRPTDENATPKTPAGNVPEKLIRQYTEIARLAGALAHEIKNPLSTIRLNMELLAEDFEEAETPRDKRTIRKIRVVQAECQRLQNLLDDFLNFAKVRQLNKRPSNLNEVLAATIDLFRPQAEAEGIEVLTYFDADLPTIHIDREAFHGAILNLLINAEQALEEGGQIVVRTYTMSDGVGIDLIDNGCGMDSETCSQVFDAFFSTKSGGSGLGLPTMRKVIEAHNGTIFVQSEPGLGTQFSIKLPFPPRLSAGDNKSEESEES